MVINHCFISCNWLTAQVQGVLAEHILAITKRVLSQVQTAQIGFLRRVNGVTLRDEVRSYEIRTTLNIDPLLRIFATLVGPCVQNVPGKIADKGTDGYTQEKAAQRSSKDQVVGLHLRPCMVSPSWCRVSRAIRGCWKPWDISSPLRTAACASLLTGKGGIKMDEWIKIFWGSTGPSSSPLDLFCCPVNWQSPTLRTSLGKL